MYLKEQWFYHDTIFILFYHSSTRVFYMYGITVIFLWVCLWLVCVYIHTHKRFLLFQAPYRILATYTVCCPKTVLFNFRIWIKEIVHPKMKMTSWFNHPQAILSVYGFLLSDEYNRSYIKKMCGSSKLYNGSEWCLRFWSKIKCMNPS